MFFQSIHTLTISLSLWSTLLIFMHEHWNVFLSLAYITISSSTTQILYTIYRYPRKTLAEVCFSFVTASQLATLLETDLLYQCFSGILVFIYPENVTGSYIPHHYAWKWPLRGVPPECMLRWKVYNYVAFLYFSTCGKSF